MITVKNLNKSYGSNHVLKDINVNFEEGKAYGIVGANGAGKTTFFRCISGLESYDGEISSSLNPIKDHLGLLETNPAILSHNTGWEYLKLMCSARHVSRDDFEQKNLFGLPLDRYASDYSTGMKKKLALTALLLQKNDLFILDEPFNGVDIHSNMVILEIIQILKEKGKTLLISSHIFSTLSASCDMIYALEGGQLSTPFLPDQYATLEEQMKSYVIDDSISDLRKWL